MKLQLKLTADAMRDQVVNGLVVGGFVAIAIGVGMISLPAGVIAAGVLSCALGAIVGLGD